MTRFFARFAMVALPTIFAASLAAPALTQPYAPGYSPGQQQYQYQQYRTYQQQSRRDRRRDEDRDRDRGDCKRGDDQVIATGGTRPTQKWALRAANAAWSRQVTASFGQEFSDISIAKEHRHDCFPGVLGGKACKVAAIPCKARSSIDMPQPR